VELFTNGIEVVLAEHSSYRDILAVDASIHSKLIGTYLVRNGADSYVRYTRLAP
jgi:hypothetical protein